MFLIVNTRMKTDSGFFLRAVRENCRKLVVLLFFHDFVP
jgi:hypothetical protein